MINTNRIVPITRTDLLSNYGTMLKIAGTSIAKVSASNPGEFKLTTGSGNMFADEPVKSVDFDGVSAAVVYFVAAFDYEGFSISGVAVTPESGSAEVVPGSATLYTATLATGKVTIAEIAV